MSHPPFTLFHLMSARVSRMLKKCILLVALVAGKTHKTHVCVLVRFMTDVINVLSSQLTEIRGKTFLHIVFLVSQMRE